MTDEDDRLLDDRRRAMLKGLAGGTLGAGVAGVAWPRVRPHLVDGEGDGERDTSAEAATNLVPREDATHVATGGTWADAAAWEGEVPGDFARVHVPAGTTVTLDHESDARLESVRVDGVLRTDPEANAQLRVDTLLVGGSGRLEVGTESAPDRGTVVKFLDRGPLDEEWDPERISRGLLALPGATVRVHGVPKTGWLPTATAPESGDERLELDEAPEGWTAGDRLVLTGMHPERDEDEELTVASVEGATVRLEESLAHDHVPPAEDLSAYVANLDRSVQFRSASDRTKRRGHVLFVTQDVDLRHAGWIDLGRTDKSRPITDPLNGTPPEDAAPNPKARYALHFHRTGIDARDDPRVVEGCVVDGSPGWGVVNHSSYVDVRDTVTYRVRGAGFVAEVGDEIGSFEGNAAIRSEGSGGLPDDRQFHEDSPGDVDDFGHGGYGFWLQGPAVAVDDNVAAGHRHHGFVYWTRAKPDREVAADRIGGTRGEIANFPVENLAGQSYLRDADEYENGAIPSSQVAIRSFSGNTVLASGGGLDLSRHRLNDDHGSGSDPSVVADFTAFNVGSFTRPWGSRLPPRSANAQGGNNGVCCRYARHVRIENPRLVSGAGDGQGIGINHNEAPRDVAVEGGTIRGWFVGIRTFYSGDSPVQSVDLDNDVDVHFVGGGTDHHWSTQRVPLADLSFSDSGRAAVYCGTELDDDLYGLFSPESESTVDGAELFTAAQRPDFVPLPASDDTADAGEDALRYLTDAAPGALVGKENAELWDEYGISVGGEPLPDDAEQPPGIEGGYLEAGGGSGLGTGSPASGADASEDDGSLGPIERVTTATGSLYELGRLGQGEPLYVYDDPEFLAVPGEFAGLPYVRFEGEDAGTERASFAYVELSSPATLYVAYDAEETPEWLAGDLFSGWSDTGKTIGTDDGTRAVYASEVDAGTSVLGGAPNTWKMYSAFVDPA